MKNLIVLMRPYQYAKNIFIFAPAFFAFELFSNALNLAIAFIAFSLICSSVYILNDILDRNLDKFHPEKKYRPIASGKVSIKLASIFALLLLAMGGGIVMYFSTPKIAIPIIFYIFLNIFYSLKLKHIAIIDIFIIASGFVIRLYIGALSANVKLSAYIVIVTFLLALFLVLAKRRDDLVIANGNKTRKNLQGYNKTFLDISMGISASLVMVAYIFYTIDSEVRERFHTDNLYLSAFFVLLGIFRYMQITFVEEQSHNPSKILLRDRFLQLTIIGYLLSFLILIHY